MYFKHGRSLNFHQTETQPYGNFVTLTLFILLLFRYFRYTLSSLLMLLNVLSFKAIITSKELEHEKNNSYSGLYRNIKIVSYIYTRYLSKILYYLIFLNNLKSHDSFLRSFDKRLPSCYMFY